MTTPAHISARLRQIRLQQQMTLKQVEIKSRGKWKAVVVGSYERGTRSLSISRAEELCHFYGVPLSQLFSSSAQVRTDEATRTSHRELWRFDLRRLSAVKTHPDNFTHLIHNFLQNIAIKRDDWNGEVITIRNTDKELLGLLTQKENGALLNSLTNRNLILKN